MAFISIRVSHLSKRILLKDYADKCDQNVIRLNAYDELLHTLRLRAATRYTELKRLTTTLDFDLPDEKANNIRKTLIGGYFNRIHTDRFCLEVADTLHGSDDPLKKRAAIRTWLEHYGIEEDELALDTAEKIFYRFRKNLPKSCTRPKRFVRPNCKISTPKNTPLSMEQAQAKAAQFAAQNPLHFVGMRQQPLKRRLRQLDIYCYTQFAAMTPHELHKRLHIPTRTTYHALRQFRRFLKTAKNLTAF